MKNASIPTAIILGAALGALLYFAPFVFFPIHLALGIVFIAFLFRWVFWGFGWRRRWAYHGYGPGWGGPWHGHGYGHYGPGPGFADKIRSMSEEEYQAFRNRFQGWNGCGPQTPTQAPNQTPPAQDPSTSTQTV